MAEKIGAHLMQNKERLQKKIAELQAQWDKLGEMLSAFKRERILETRVEEKIRLDQKIKETIIERQDIEQELDKLETQLEQLHAEPEKRELSKERADFEVEQKTPQQPASAQPEPERPKVTEKEEPEGRPKDITTESRKQDMSPQTDRLKPMGWKFWLLWIGANIIGFWLMALSDGFLSQHMSIDNWALRWEISEPIIPTLQWLVIHLYISSFQTLWWIGVHVIVYGFFIRFAYSIIDSNTVNWWLFFFLGVVLGPILVWKFRKSMPGKS